MSLQIQSLSKTYEGGIKALDNVSLDIPKGVFGLLGPNGAGKTTLMNTIATLQIPDSGSVYFEDINALQEKEKLRRILGYLPQVFGFYEDTDALNIPSQLSSSGIWVLSFNSCRRAFGLPGYIKRCDR